MAESIPIPNEFDDANDFWTHPIYDKWESNRLGIVRHLKNKKDIGSVKNTGYLHITLNNAGKKIHYLKHRFIYECFHGLISDLKLVCDHINNIKSDNRLENLQLITQSENVKKENPKGVNRAPIPVRATSVNSGESYEYDSMYKCSKDLDIDIGLIRYVLNGVVKTATSKKDKCKYTFEKLNCKTETNAIKVRALNLTTGETSEYISIKDCSRTLDINYISIIDVLKGRHKTAKSKKDKCKYRFEKNELKK